MLCIVVCSGSRTVLYSIGVGDGGVARATIERGVCQGMEEGMSGCNVVWESGRVYLKVCGSVWARLYICIVMRFRLVDCALILWRKERLVVDGRERLVGIVVGELGLLLRGSDAVRGCDGGIG